MAHQVGVLDGPGLAVQCRLPLADTFNICPEAHQVITLKGWGHVLGNRIDPKQGSSGDIGLEVKLGTDMARHKRPQFGDLAGLARRIHWRAAGQGAVDIFDKHFEFRCALHRVATAGQGDQLPRFQLGCAHPVHQITGADQHTQGDLVWPRLGQRADNRIGCGEQIPEMQGLGHTQAEQARDGHHPVQRRNLLQPQHRQDPVGVHAWQELRQYDQCAIVNLQSLAQLCPYVQ